MKSKWNFALEDEEGMIHDIEIPNTLYAPNAPFHLLSPQYWSQQNQNKEETSYLMQHDRMTLTWEGGKYSKHVMLNKDNNCGFIKSWKQDNKYGKFLQDMSALVKHNTTGIRLTRPSKIKDGNDNIKPITPYNFENTVMTDRKQKEVEENNDN